MSTNMTNKYNKRDVAQLRKSLIDQIPNLTSHWTNYNESDLGMAFVELICGVGDMLGFYLDKQSLETYLPTVVQRKNAKAILNTINYQLDMMTPCTTKVVFTLEECYYTDIVIPKYTQVRTVLDNDTKIYYATADTTVIPRDKLSAEVTVLQGIHHKCELKVKDLLASNKLHLTSDDIAQGTMTITIDGVEWTEVPDVVIDDIEGPKYSVHEDKHDKAYILFHANYTKFLPLETAPVVIEYLTTLGSKGVVRANSLTQLDSAIYLNEGVNLQDRMKVTNPEPGTGGSDRESIDHARTQAPKEFATMGVAVTLEDFQVLASGFAGVDKAIALDWTVDDRYYVDVPYKVKVIVLPSSGDVASEQFLSDIKAYLDKNRISSVIVETESVEYVDVDLTLEVNHRYPETESGRIRSLIMDEVKSYFIPSNLEFSRNIRVSNITTSIETKFSGVRYVDISSSITSHNLQRNQVPRLRNLIVDMIRSGV